MASTTSEEPMLSPSSGTFADPPPSRAIPSHELASGIQSVGRSSSACSVKPTAASSAAIPDLSLLATTVTHVPSTSRGWALYASASEATISAFSNDESARTVVHGSAPGVAAGSSAGNTIGSGSALSAGAAVVPPCPASMAAVTAPPTASSATTAPAIAIQTTRRRRRRPSSRSRRRSRRAGAVSGASRIDGPPGRRLPRP
jgi:hypothetical protein